MASTDKQKEALLMHNEDNHCKKEENLEDVSGGKTINNEENIIGNHNIVGIDKDVNDILKLISILDANGEFDYLKGDK